MVTEDGGIQTVNPFFAEYLPASEGKKAFSGYGHRSVDRFIRDVRELMTERVTLEQLENNRPCFREALVSTAVVDAVNQSLEDNFSWRDVDVSF